MEKWLSLSLLLPIFSVLYSTATKFAQIDTKIDSTLYTFFVLSFSALIGIIYFFAKGKKLKITWETVVGGIIFGFAACGFNLGIKKSKNPALAQAVYRFQAVITAIGGYLFFHDKFSFKGALGILLAIGGVILLASKKIKESLQNKKSEDLQSNKKPKNKEADDNKILGLPEWLFYAGGGGILLSIKDFLAIKAMKKGLAPLDFAIQLNLLGALLTLGLSIYFRSFDKLKNISFTDLKSLGASFFAGLVEMIWSFIVTMAMKIAPNPGYPKAITELGVVISAILSPIIYKKGTLNTQEWGGIGSIVLGVVLIIFDTDKSKHLGK